MGFRPRSLPLPKGDLVECQYEIGIADAVNAGSADFMVDTLPMGRGKNEEFCRTCVQVRWRRKLLKTCCRSARCSCAPEQPFTWASGIKSPIYCDNRLTLTAPVVRGHVEAGLAEIVRTKFPEAEVLMGTSTAGIAHAAITATILDLPMGYVRAARRTTAAATGSRAGSKRARRSS